MTIFHMELRRLKSLHPGIVNDPSLQCPSEQHELGPMARDSKMLWKEVLPASLILLFILLLFNTPEESSFVFKQPINFLQVTQKRLKYMY